MKAQIAFHFKTLLIITSGLILMYGCIDDEFTQADPDLPTVSISDVIAEEGDVGRTFDFVVTLEGFSATNAGLGYIIEDGTATWGQDFDGPTEGTLLFGVNETQKVISVPILADVLKEEDETFSITLQDPVNLVLSTDRAEGTILNDDIFDQAIFIPDSGYVTPDSYPGMEMVWSDEFEGTEINTDNWDYDIGRGNNGWGNNELQYYREENAYIFQNVLVIEAKEESFQGADYTSARLKTQGKQSFRYGRIDIRAVTPETQGMWPALWMLGTNITQVGWPACGEIDIMELRGQEPDRVLGTVHFGPSFAERQERGSSKLLTPPDKFSNEWHVFSLVWEEDSITWLVDDEEYFQFTADDVGNTFYPFNNSFFFVLNVAVGGNFPGSPDANTIFPQRMLVDYIRVFQ